MHSTAAQVHISENMQANPRPCMLGPIKEMERPHGGPTFYGTGEKEESWLANKVSAWWSLSLFLSIVHAIVKSSCNISVLSLKGHNREKSCFIVLVNYSFPTPKSRLPQDDALKNACNDATWKFPDQQ